jgi:hypothetical protein
MFIMGGVLASSKIFVVFFYWESSLFLLGNLVFKTPEALDYKAFCRSHARTSSIKPAKRMQEIKPIMPKNRKRSWEHIQARLLRFL